MSSHSHQPVHVSPGSWFTACAIDDALRELEDESLGGGSRTSRWGESLGRVAGGRLGGRWACVTACAAFLGDLELVRLARDCGHEWDAYTCAFAAYSGNLECLKYAHEHGCPWNKSTCRYAAWNGDLESLKYAHEHGCPWDEETCACAAYSGHLECLKYAHERGCPWDAKTYFCAMSNGNMEVILFLIEREHPHAQSLRLTWEKVAMPILPDADAVIGLEIALSRHRHRHDADGGHVSLREILPFWREHRRLYDEAHRAARVDALLPEIDKERRRLTDAG